MSLRLYPLKFALFVLTVTCFFSDVNYANEHEQKLIELIDFETPAGPGPYPIVVLVSGCRGFNYPFYDRAHTKLVENGFATVRVDYMGARNATTCSESPTNTRIARDILTVLEKLSGMESVIDTRVNILGWYTGAAGTLRMLRMLEDRPDIQVASVSGYYTKCINVDPWLVEVPVLMLMGGADKAASAADCRKLARKNTTAQIKIEEYEGAFRWFDDSDLPAEKEFSFGTAGYQQEAAEKAWAELMGFLIR